MNSIQIKKSFVSFFEKKNHTLRSSSSLIPSNDPTLLFTNAGMVQFKDEFTGQSQPKQKRAVSIQKCVRAGGKHNDLENVGFTARHHTFFEMLGNFSFGDYFKKEAISFAWEFLTKELKIDKSKLYVTVHHTDQEAADIWHEQEGVPRERIFFRGDKDNFWQMGDTGPCGPCSEIFYDHGEKNADPNADTSECILDDEMRYVEIWNLVFMQFERFQEGSEIKQKELPKPSVDTGAGLERLAAVLQGKYNNFDTDCFSSIIKQIESISKKKYSDHPQWMRVIADHARSCTLLLSDGVLPSNEGRGYVLRRIIRRAIRHLDLLGVKEVEFYQLTPTVLDSLGDSYAEAKQNSEFIQKYLVLEEESFRKTLSSGLKLLESLMSQMSTGDTLDGQDVFTLYDTHGFPVDLTQMILSENGYGCDEAGFEKAMQEQKERSKAASSFKASGDSLEAFYRVKEEHGETSFLGYDSLNATGKLLAIEKLKDHYALIFDQTPFYAESGGQQGDRGFIGEVKVIDTQKPIEGLHAHLVEKVDHLKVGDTYQLQVDTYTRQETMAHHTGTHLLQAALIQVLGDHIKQAGSSNSDKRLRFDFTHPEAVKDSELKAVEKLINQQIKKATQVQPVETSKDEALKMGAMALFGEKYGDEVRVIHIPGFSVELCGGTHVQSTSDIKLFKIVSESSLSSGVRRIEAVCSDAALAFLNDKVKTLDAVEKLMKSKGDDLISKIERLQLNLKAKEKEIKQLQEAAQAQSVKSLLDDVDELANGCVFKHISLKDGDPRKVGDMFIDKYPNGIVLIDIIRGDKASVLLKTSKSNKELQCSQILSQALEAFDGRGGGKADMAQGSVSASNISQVIENIKNVFNI